MCKVFELLKERIWAFVAIMVFIFSLLTINSYFSSSIFPSNFPIVGVANLKEKNASFYFSCSLVNIENRNYAIVGDRIDCSISYKGLIEANTNFPFVDFGLASTSSVKKIWNFYRWEEYASSSLGSNGYITLNEEGINSVYLFVSFGETTNALTTFPVYSLTTFSTARNNRNLLLVAALSLSFSIFVAFKNLRDLFQKKGGKT